MVHPSFARLIARAFLPTLVVAGGGCSSSGAEDVGQSGARLAGTSVWIVGSLDRIGRTDPAGSATEAQVAAGRGEYESFQIIVQGPPGGLSNVNVTASALDGPNGAVIPKSDLTLFREQYVTVTSSSPNWGGSNQPLGPGDYPDGLIPFVDPSTGASLSGGGAALTAVPFAVAAGQNQPIWVDVFVPRDATPGAYTGTYSVTSNQGSFTGTIALTAWAFTLPLVPALKSSFLFWNSVPEAAYAELLRNKLNPLSEPASEQPALMDDGLGSVGLPFFSGADVSNCTMTSAPSAAAIQAAVAANTPGLYEYCYSADEIGGCGNLFPVVQQWGLAMHRAGVDNLVTMAPVPQLFDDGSGSGRSAVDDWTVLPIEYDQSTYIGQALQKGDKIWSYNTLVQDSYSPKWLVDFAPMNFRIQPGFISASLSLTGLLYWRIDDWASDPWTQINNAGLFSSSNYPGEGVLLYPGQDVGIQGVAPSMRIKWLRDGVEDFDYVELLKQAGRGAWALQQAATLAPDWTNWTRDTMALAATRMILGQALDQLGGGPGAGGAGSGGGADAGAVAEGGAGKADAGQTGAGSLAAVSVTPSSGSGSAQDFQFVYTDPGGASDIAYTGVLINSAVNGLDSCWFVYDRANNSISLASDDTSTWISAGLGTSMSVANSQCSILGSDVSVTGTGNTLAIGANVSFLPSFAGPRTVYSIAFSRAGISTGYTSVGTWTVAVPPLGGVAVSPSSGSGASASLQMTFADPGGYANIAFAGTLISPTLNGARACWFVYDASNQEMAMASDDASTWSWATIGSAKTLQNSQCAMLASDVTVKGAGAELTITAAVSFTSAFAGTRSVYLYADSATASSGDMALGTWTVP